MSDLLALAVQNNAEWCARICGLHGAPGRFGHAAWASHFPAPRYYPNLVTLRPDCAAAQMEQVAAMPRRLPQGWGVKDSFAALDLAPLGFRRAIEGRWIRHADSGAQDAGRDLEWRAIDSHLALVRWEAAWGGQAHAGHPRIFPPELLTDAAVRVFGGFSNGEVVAGGIVNAAAGVAGLSNLFAADPAHRPAAIGHAHSLAGGLPLVGWEAADQEDAGETLGELRVWLNGEPR